MNKLERKQAEAEALLLRSVNTLVSDVDGLGVTGSVYSVCERLWRTTEATHPLYDQFVRACTSVGANLAEGMGRCTKEGYVAFARIATGSLAETYYFAKLIGDKILLERVEELAVKLKEDIEKHLATFREEDA